MSKTDADKAWKLYQRLVHFGKPYWGAFVIGIIATIIGSGVTSLLAWIIKPVINQGFIARDPIFIKWLPLALILILTTRGAAGFISNYCLSRVGRSMVMRFRQLMFQHAQALPARFFDHQSSGKLLSILLYNVEQIAVAVTSTLVRLLSNVCLIVGLIFVMFSINWRLSLMFLVMGPVMYWVGTAASKRMRRISNKVQDTMGEVTTIAEESFEGYKVVRTFGGQAYEAGKFNQATKASRNRELKVVITNSLSSTVIQILAAIPLALTIFLATSKYINISAGGFAAIVGAMMALLNPLRQITRLIGRIQQGLAGAQSVFDFLDETPEQDQGTHTVKRVKGLVECRHVGFSYQAVDEQTTPPSALNDISFTIKPGQTVALVGASGAGKSTLASLLPRFYDVTSGEILIDGIRINDYKLKDLRNQFSIVDQHVVLFNDTIANNIAYAQPQGEVTEARLREVARAAHALDFIEALPNGFNTLVGENGVLLSGGQRQRLAIARAILRDAPILILDEATSALDTEAERHIQAAMESLMQNRTTLVIAHRLSTIEHADHIIALDKGRIIEQGTHTELIALNGHYARLCQLQFNVETNSTNMNDPAHVV